VTDIQDSQLCGAVEARFYAVNGTHPMTPEDDAYVNEWYVPLEALAERTGTTASELRQLMLANRLPLPSYIRSDGRQMVARDLLELPRRAGGYEQLPEWFGRQFKSGRDAIREWDGYLRGQYVCLRDVLPETIQRKNKLVKDITAAMAKPEPENDDWLESLHRLVDELDELEPPFTPYDRLRFGGPISRDTCINEVRARFPRRTLDSSISNLA
jgi:hypothetical protein